MSIKIALAGNPNCGKTTLFNNLTGSNQYVGNWPGVTVEKKEGKLKGEKDVIIQDLPGIYSLSPYTLEEVVSRTYLVKEKPDAILNIIDGTNIERNLYLTTQLIELGIPVVMAVNMIDLVRKNGDKIDLKKLSAELGCQAVEISALKGEGTEAAAKAAMAAAKAGKAGELPHVFTGSVEHAIAHIEESIQGKVDDRFLRWYAVKLFERDEKVVEELKLDKALADHIDEHIKDCEKEMDDDAESIITNQRYSYINGVVDKAVKKKARVEHLTASDKIDQIVTNRVLALPIFALVMFLMYSLSMGTSIADGGWAIGTFATDWTNDVLFGEIVPGALGGFLESIGVAGWLYGLIMDGIVAGVGAVLGAVLALRLPSRFVSLKTLLVALMSVGLGSLLYVGTPYVGVALVGQIALGVAWGVVNPLHNTIVQTTAPLEQLGRVNSVMGFGNMFAGVAPLAIAPWLAATFGVQRTLVGAGMVVTAVPAALLLFGRRHFDRAARQ